MAPKKKSAVAAKQQGEAFAKRTTFYVNMEWEADPDPKNQNYLRGQMYVESLEPEKRTQEFPLIFIHGDYHSSQIWLTKPDGQPGWASFFLGNGYQVYLVDLPGTGKSNYLRKDEINSAEVRSIRASQIEKGLTAPKFYSDLGNLGWPTVLRHEKWPGTGRKGDHAFEMYCAHLSPLYFSTEERQNLAQNALKKLLKCIGRAVLVGEGTGATAAWLAADVAPESVVGVVAVEPPGPPFCESTRLENNKRKYDTFTKFDPNRLKYGLAGIPLTYDPPARPETKSDGDTTSQHPLDLALFVHENTGKQMVLQYSPENIPEGFIFMEHLTNGAGPMHVRKLANLRKMRHVIITGEASSHSAYDIVTMRFMNQAGLTVDCGFLERYGTHGNGHLMFLETNSDDVAMCVMRWIQTKAGHIDTPVVVVEPEVTIVPHQTAKAPSVVIDQDEEPKRSPKRARTDSIPNLAPDGKSKLVDLTGHGQMTATSCANQNLHSDSERNPALSSGCKRMLPRVSMMPPPQSRFTGTSTVKAKPPMGGRVKLECQDSPPQRSVSFAPKADLSGVPASIPIPDNTTPQKTSSQPTATRQRESGNFQQEAAQDGSFTSYRFQYSSSYPQNQSIPQDTASSGQNSSNSSQATPRQMSLMLPEASQNNYGMQSNPYMWPMQIASTTSNPADQVPRSVPNFSLPANPQTAAAPVQQDDVFMSADPTLQLDGMPTDFEYDFSCFDGMTEGELKSFIESCDFTAAWQG